MAKEKVHTAGRCNIRRRKIYSRVRLTEGNSAHHVLSSSNQLHPVFHPLQCSVSTIVVKCMVDHTYV